ncbi:MAG: ribosome small subunit-dependent GTPase A [Steroidobacteraceae bacterium]|jgi:ribosome biogenesis GTPase
MPARFPVKKSGRGGAGARLPGAAPSVTAAAAAGTGSRARVIAAHGRMLHVRLEQGGEAVVRAMGRNLQVVCGDYVRCQFDARHDELRIAALEPRSGALYRSNAHGSGELIAANLSLLLVVVAPLPVPDFYIVDRYLAAAQCAGIRARVVLNKCELGIDALTEAGLRDYAGLGLEPLRVSAQTASGLPQLRALLHEQSAAMVGQSGVGKSSLLRALVPDSAAAIGTLLRDNAGRHTTSASWLYSLPQGGAIIDSPGVRDFAPAIDRLTDAALGFTEIAALSARCRFGDCRHLREPGCAVRDAAGGALSARRYESYRRLRRLWERLRQPSG